MATFTPIDLTAAEIYELIKFYQRGKSEALAMFGPAAPGAEYAQRRIDYFQRKLSENFGEE